MDPLHRPEDLPPITPTVAAPNSGLSNAPIVVDLSSDDEANDQAINYSFDDAFGDLMFGGVQSDGIGGLGFDFSTESNRNIGGDFFMGIQGGDFGGNSGSVGFDFFRNQPGESFGFVPNANSDDSLFPGFGPFLENSESANVVGPINNNSVGYMHGVVDLNVNFGGEFFREGNAGFNLFPEVSTNTNLGLDSMQGIGNMGVGRANEASSSAQNVNSLPEFSVNTNIGLNSMRGIGGMSVGRANEASSSLQNVNSMLGFGVNMNIGLDSKRGIGGMSVGRANEASSSSQNVNMDVDSVEPRNYLNEVALHLGVEFDVGTVAREERKVVPGNSDVIMVEESSVEEVHEVINVEDDEEVNYLNIKEFPEQLPEENIQMQQLQQRRDENRQRAILYAPRYALPERSLRDNKNVTTSAQVQQVDDELPGPFSAGLQIVKKRMEPKKLKTNEAVVLWRPSVVVKDRPKLPPSLKDLSLMALSCYSEHIESLKEIPSNLKHTLMMQMCRSRKMNAHILRLYLNKATTEIHLYDCSVITEEDMREALAQCNMNLLKVVKLGMCGRCMSDHLIKSTLATSLNCLPSLTTLSLKGAYCLTDDGLRVLASSAPHLKSLNLGQCSLVTSRGISFLAEKLNIVELYLDDCQNINAMGIVPALNKLQHLEVFSAARLPNVSNDFVGSLVVACGSNMKELILTDCRDLTSLSAKSIGSNCPQLCALDLQKVVHLDDSAMKYLANGCRSLKRLKLRNNAFSDETVAAYLEASGHSLVDISFNNVTQVGRQTAISISRNCCSSLNYLDLSFCRQITDELLGLIVDNCSHLRTLKLFGCTQITPTLVDAHFNPQVKIIGLKDQLLIETEMPIFLESVIEF